MRTAVVVLNWNTREYLRRFLPPLMESLDGTDAFAVVADNGSDDGSREVLAEEFPGIHSILLDRNYGFTGGYNRALKKLADSEDAPEYVVLLNSDVLVRPGWIEVLTEYMDTHPECGVCGPKLHKLQRNGADVESSCEFEYAGAAGGLIDRLGFPFCRGRVLSRTEADEGQYDEGSGLFWVSGACLMTRMELWTQLCGLDERFFAHMEEIDFCWRAQLAGWKIACATGAVVWHLGGGSLPQESPRKLMLNYRNSMLMLGKNLPLTVGAKRAERTIRTRRFIDNCASVAYLLMGKREYRDAVKQAHREADALLQESDKVVSDGKCSIEGYMPLSIILQAFLRGKGIFKYLRSYENSHRRCR